MWFFEINIPVLHSLSSERWQNFTKIPWVYSKKRFFSKHLNKVILATILLILRIWMVLNSSVASMTSTVLITSLASMTSMTSTASLASKNQKQHAVYIPSDFSWHQKPQRPQWPQQPQQPQWPQWPLQPHFIKKIIQLDVSIKPGTKMTYPGLLMWDGSSILLIFGTLSVGGCGGQGCYF